jgi:hypothetical protein
VQDVKIHAACIVRASAAPQGRRACSEWLAANTLRMNVDEAGHRSENWAVAEMAAGASDLGTAS